MMTRDVGHALSLWLEGKFISMLLVGVLVTALTWAIGLPSPAALGLIAGIADFIPYVGPAIAAIPDFWWLRRKGRTKSCGHLLPISECIR